jgi:peptide chain release factor subunit 1
MALLDEIDAQLDRLAAFEAGPFPVVSLYLNLQPDERGRDRFEPFLKKEFGDRLRTYETQGPERQSLEKDFEKIGKYANELRPSANGLALFACSGADLFEALQLTAPVDAHRLYISREPHLYPLARLLDEYPRYAVVVTDTNLARIYVFAANTVERAEQVAGVKVRRHKMGGWSQARYQRHVENYHLQHVKDVVDALERIVRDDRIASVIVAGDEVVVPRLKEQLSKELTARLVDVVKLDIRAPEREILDLTIARMREKDAVDDRERVQGLLDAYRANGLAVVGVESTRRALELGQADELVITAALEMLDASHESFPDSAGDRTVAERVANELIAKARQTSASVRFVQDGSLLAGVGGVGALLRFRL